MNFDRVVELKIGMIVHTVKIERIISLNGCVGRDGTYPERAMSKAFLKALRHSRGMRNQQLRCCFQATIPFAKST